METNYLMWGAVAVAVLWAVTTFGPKLKNLLPKVDPDSNPFLDEEPQVDMTLDIYGRISMGRMIHEWLSDEDEEGARKAFEDIIWPALTRIKEDIE